MRVIVSGKRQLLKVPAVIGAVALVVITASFLLIKGSAKGDDPATAGVNDRPAADVTVAASGGGEAVAVAAILGTLENYGASDAEQAVTIWAEGVASKNGVTQYSVMSSELKEKYLEVIDKNNDGKLLFAASSGNIDSWFVSEIADNDDGTQTAKLRFTMGEQVAAAELTLCDEGEYVVVNSVAVETPLYEFTGIG